MSADAIDSLTPREREILTLIAEGDSLAEIAQKLSRSLKTIESHRLSLGRKLKANNRVELAKIAFTSGLVSLEGQDRVSSPDTAGTDEQLIKWINLINASIRQATGRELLERFCVAASKLPGIDIAAICTCDIEQHGHEGDIYNRVVMAASDRGEIAEPMRYHAMQTPCQQVIDQGSCCVTQGIQDLFPSDPWLKEIGADSYLGIQLPNAQGEQVGGVGLIGREPMDDLEAFRNLIDFFGPRLAGAIEVCREIESLRSENDRLQADLVAPAIPSDVVPTQADQQSYRDAFERIAERIRPLAGAGFLREIVDAICQELDLYAGGVCKLESGPICQTLHSVSFCINNAQGDPIHYNPTNTPCEVVLNTGHRCDVDHAIQTYPEDEFFKSHDIRSYCGIRLPSPTGKTAGVIWFVNQAAMDDPKPITQLLQYYAPRVGSELYNFMQLEALQQDREKLEEQLAQTAR